MSCLICLERLDVETRHYPVRCLPRLRSVTVSDSARSAQLQMTQPLAATQTGTGWHQWHWPHGQLLRCLEQGLR